ncbi:hypothetical protein SprV_0401533300 [Sparganum proliferum]
MDPHLLVLLPQLAVGEDHVRGPTMTTESAPVSSRRRFQMAVEAVKKDAGEYLSDDLEQGNVSVVVADLAVPFAFTETDDCGVLEVLRNFSLAQHCLEEHSQVID